MLKAEVQTNLNIGSLDKQENSHTATHPIRNYNVMVWRSIFHRPFFIALRHICWHLQFLAKYHIRPIQEIFAKSPIVAMAAL